MIFCTIWYHLYNLTNVKNIHGGVLLFNFTKSNTPPWMFFTFFKLCKWYHPPRRNKLNVLSTSSVRSIYVLCLHRATHHSVPINLSTQLFLQLKFENLFCCIDTNTFRKSSWLLFCFASLADIVFRSYYWYLLIILMFTLITTRSPSINLWDKI